MLTLLLAGIDSFGTARFELLYVVTFFFDIAIFDTLIEYLKKEKK